MTYDRKTTAPRKQSAHSAFFPSPANRSCQIPPVREKNSPVLNSPLPATSASRASRRVGVGSAELAERLAHQPMCRETTAPQARSLSPPIAPRRQPRPSSFQRFSICLRPCQFAAAPMIPNPPSLIPPSAFPLSALRTRHTRLPFLIPLALAAFSRQRPSTTPDQQLPRVPLSACVFIHPGRGLDRLKIPKCLLFGTGTHRMSPHAQAGWRRPFSRISIFQNKPIRRA